MIDTANYPGVFFYITIGSVIVLNSKWLIEFFFGQWSQVWLTFYSCQRDLPEHRLRIGCQVAIQVHRSCGPGHQSKRNNSCPDQHHVDNHVSQCQNCRHLLFHHGLVHTVSLLRHLLRFAIKCKWLDDELNNVLLLLNLFSTQRFFRYHEHVYNKIIRDRKKFRQISRSRVFTALPSHSTRRSIPYLTIFKKCFPQCLNVFLIFFVTLTIFPAVYSGKIRVKCTSKSGIFEIIPRAGFFFCFHYFLVKLYFYYYISSLLVLVVHYAVHKDDDFIRFANGIYQRPFPLAVVFIQVLVGSHLSNNSSPDQRFAYVIILLMPECRHYYFITAKLLACFDTYSFTSMVVRRRCLTITFLLNLVSTQRFFPISTNTLHTTMPSLRSQKADIEIKAD